MADEQLDALRGIVARGLVDRAELHSRMQTSLTDEQTRSPSAATVAAVDAMVTMSTIPDESRVAAAAATATMLAEDFDELPALVAEWRADGADLAREAERYGATLGDRTLTAIRTFEVQPPDPRAPLPDRGQAAAAHFLTDPAVPPLRRVRTPAAETRNTGDAPRAGGIHRNSPDTPSR